MSLIDALLLDPAPLDVYIALRSDNAKGSGTQDDPWSGGVRNTPLSTIDSIAVSGTIPAGFIAVVTTLADHGFKNGDLVLIKGVPCGTHTYDYLSNGKFLNGTFIVSQVTARTFSYALPAYPTDSTTLLDPRVTGGPFYSFYNDYGTSSLLVPTSVSSPAVGLTCQADPYLFDSIMRSLSAAHPITVHLGPGTFLTRGYSPMADPVSWQPRFGMKIIGSGMAQTTLKLVEATLDHNKYFVIGTTIDATFDDVSVENLTLDANVGGQPSPLLTCQGIYVQGSHTRFRNVRVINFGPQTLELECFPVGFAGANVAVTGSEIPTDCVMEGCIAEAPGRNPARETTVLACIKNSVPPPFDSRSSYQGFHQSCVIRDSFVNCEYQADPVAIDVSQITLIPDPTDPLKTVARMKTRTAHGLTSGSPAFLPISGSFDAVNGYNNGFNGAYVLTVLDPFTFYYTPAALSPLPKAESEMWVRRWPSQQIPLAAPGGASGGITNVNQPGTVATMTVKTASPHFLTAGNLAVLSSISLIQTNPPPCRVNGVWVVDTIVDRLTFTCHRTFPPGVMIDASNDGSNLNLYSANMGVPFQGVSIDGGSAAIMEGNLIENCGVGGPYHDTYSTKDFIVRRNHFRNVRSGLYQNLAGGSLTLAQIYGSKLEIVGQDPVTGEFIAEFSDIGGQAHNLTVGQGVIVTATVNHFASAYSGTFKISAISAPDKFQYKISTNPGSPADVDANSPWYRPLVQVENSVIEDNIYELIPGASDGTQCFALNFAGDLSNSDWDPSLFRIFRRIVIRNNLIRYASYPDGNPLPGNVADSAVQLLACEFALIEQNTIDLLNRKPIYHKQSCTTVKYFMNQTAAGVLVQGTYLTGSPLAQSYPQDEPATLIEDALALVLM